IRRNNGENAFFLHHGKKTRGNDVDAGKRQRLWLGRRANQGIGLIAPGPTTAKLKPLVKEQVPGSLAVLYRQSGEGVIFQMKFDHATEVNRADDVDIVQNERGVGIRRILQEKIGSLLQAAAGIE